MPQKRNPDAAELVRGKVGQVVGALTQLLIIVKGLPLSYGKDLQDDKAPTFAASDAMALVRRGDGRHGARHDGECGTHA